MKGRRKNFNKIMVQGPPRYWDRQARVMRHVGEGKKTEPWSSTRYLRRHAAKNLARSQSRDKHTDRAIDRVLDLEEEAQGQFERVGLKFKPVEGAGE